jgi:hypothetical protein
MSKKQHTSDEFGKQMSTFETGGFGDQGGSNMGAPSQILITGIDEEKSGITPSSFSIPGWKIVLTLAIVFAIGVGGVYWLVSSGGYGEMAPVENVGYGR